MGCYIEKMTEKVTDTILELPLGKALTVVESDIQCKNECLNDDYQCPINCCKDCDLKTLDNDICDYLACSSLTRKDGKNIIYKIVNIG